MGWQAASIVEQRFEFVTLATAEGANISVLCRRFGISPPGMNGHTIYRGTGTLLCAGGLSPCARALVKSRVNHFDAGSSVHRVPIDGSGSGGAVPCASRRIHL